MHVQFCYLVSSLTTDSMFHSQSGDKTHAEAVLHCPCIIDSQLASSMLCTNLEVNYPFCSR